MTSVGMCMICGKPASHSCVICGRLVCDDHYNPVVGMCTLHAPKMKQAEDTGNEPLSPAR